MTGGVAVVMMCADTDLTDSTRKINPQRYWLNRRKNRLARWVFPATWLRAPHIGHVGFRMPYYGKGTPSVIRHG
jgi:hypothetical protein